MIPAGFTIIIIDLKDCFFIIPIHDNDKEKFAFTLPSINNEKNSSIISMESTTSRHEKQSHHMSGLCPCSSHTLL
jgi:hypothetical protein